LLLLWLLVVVSGGCDGCCCHNRCTIITNIQNALDSDAATPLVRALCQPLPHTAVVERLVDADADLHAQRKGIG
jgi:hypothetical protein